MSTCGNHSERRALPLLRVPGRAGCCAPSPPLTRADAREFLALATEAHVKTTVGCRCTLSQLANEALP